MFLWVKCGQALLEVGQAQRILLVPSGCPVKPWHSQCIPNSLDYYTAKNYGLAFFLLVVFFSSFPLQLVQEPVKESITGNSVQYSRLRRRRCLLNQPKTSTLWGQVRFFCVTWSVPGAGMRRGRTLQLPGIEQLPLLLPAEGFALLICKYCDWV